MVGADRHLRDDWRRRVDFAGRPNRFLDLVQIAESFENEKIGAPLSERGELLAKYRARFFLTRWPIGLEPNAEWTYGAGDEHRMCRLIRHPARDRCRPAVDRLHLTFQPVLRELDTIRAEAVRLQNFRARLHVLAMNLRNQL